MVAGIRPPRRAPRGTPSPPPPALRAAASAALRAAALPHCAPRAEASGKPGLNPAFSVATSELGVSTSTQAGAAWTGRRSVYPWCVHLCRLPSHNSHASSSPEGPPRASAAPKETMVPSGKEATEAVYTALLWPSARRRSRCSFASTARAVQRSCCGNARDHALRKRAQSACLQQAHGRWPAAIAVSSSRKKSSVYLPGVISFRLRPLKARLSSRCTLLVRSTCNLHASHASLLCDRRMLRELP
mmetsp:Transcript_38201/g.89406  ORF Transcript_38201/g.89406 Transcript_38201/m.89406 type:complete len:244 (-) Transcript_38201:182-913(-)